MPFITLSIHLIFGRPTGLEAISFHLDIFLKPLSSGIHSTSAMANWRPAAWFIPAPANSQVYFKKSELDNVLA
jgi:hypothetical protein